MIADQSVNAHVPFKILSLIKLSLLNWCNDQKGKGQGGLNLLCDMLKHRVPVLVRQGRDFDKIPGADFVGHLLALLVGDVRVVVGGVHADVGLGADQDDGHAVSLVVNLGPPLYYYLPKIWGLCYEDVSRRDGLVDR